VDEKRVVWVLVRLPAYIIIIIIIIIIIFTFTITITTIINY